MRWRQYAAALVLTAGLTVWPARPGYEAGSALQSTPATGISAPAARYLVVLVLDGARPDYFNLRPLPNLQALTAQGTSYRNAWAGILESVTPAGHAAISTGTEPRSTSVLGFGWRTGDSWRSIFNPDTVRTGVLRQTLQDSGSPTIAGLVHGYDPTAKVVALGGYKYYANDALGGPDSDATIYYADTPNGHFAPRFMPGHAPPRSVLTSPGLVAPTTWSHLPLGESDHLAMQLAVASVKHMRERVMLVNLPDFDMPLGHVLGANRASGAVRTLMHGFDRDLGDLEAAYRAAGILDQTLFVITADHGFAPIDRRVRMSDLQAVVHTTGATMQHAVFQTGSYIWLNRPARRRVAAAALARVQPSNIQAVYVRETADKQTVYRRVTVARRFVVPGMEEVNQYLLRSFAGSSSPDIVVLFREHVAGQRSDHAIWKGDHGGADWESQHIPLIISGPGVRPGQISDAPARLIDIAPTALELLGIPHSAMQGIPLADALLHPSDGAVAGQQAANTLLTPFTTALATEAQHELHAKVRQAGTQQGARINTARPQPHSVSHAQPRPRVKPGLADEDGVT